jgi:hypothetical protein
MCSGKRTLWTNRSSVGATKFKAVLSEQLLRVVKPRLHVLVSRAHTALERAIFQVISFRYALALSMINLDGATTGRTSLG